MHVTLLAVPGCPHLPVLEERLAEALGDMPAVTVSSQMIATEEEAARGARPHPWRSPPWAAASKPGIPAAGST
jgi:hypothetical protein